MKVSRHILWIVSCLANLLIALIASPALAVPGNDSGNGGGGLLVNGRYMTFYSAGIIVEPTELTSASVPQLDALIHLMMTLPELVASDSTNYLKALLPTTTRKYYNVQANQLTPEMKAGLLAEYARVSGVDVSKIVLFAITDTKSKTTYLLPEFYSLQKPSEKAAILFHEAFWLTHPTADYNEVVSAESAFQRYFEDTGSADKLLNWLSYVVSPIGYVRAAYSIDSKTHTLDRLRDANGYIPLINLLGSSSEADPSPGELQQLYALSLEIPQSFFLRALISKMSEGYKLATVYGRKEISLYLNYNCTLAPYSNVNTQPGLEIDCVDKIAYLDLDNQSKQFVPGSTEGPGGSSPHP